MSQLGALIQEIENVVRRVLAEQSGSTDSGDAPDVKSDVTQLKKENTGLRNRVKTLEEKVDALEKAAKPSTTATAGSASVRGTAHGTK